MAKKKEKTLEEKLQEALVPENQWPYILPENWCWTRLENVANWGSGGTPSRKHPEYYQGNIPWIKTGELKDDFIYDAEEHISEEAISKSNAKLFPVNTVVLAMYGATIGKAGIMGCELATNQACACGVSNESINYRFLFEYIKSQKDGFIASGKGGAQPNISQQIIKSYPIPLPPLPEQKRIVYRIESLFSKLDEAKEKIQQVLDGAEMRKAAILHKAFTGELTKTWRKENGISEDSWEVKKLKDITTPKAGFAFNSKKFTSEGYQIIRMGNLYGGKLDLDRVPVFYAPENIDEKIKKRAMLHDNDIVITLTGTKYKRDYGYAVLIKEPVNLFLNQRILALSPIEKIVNPTFLLYSLRSKDFRDIFFSNETGGVNQGNVSSKFVENIKIKIPLLEEQREIVKVLNHQLEFVDDTTKICKDAYEQIDTMKKSILAKAFRGELGKNNPTEDSALKLLKEVLQDKF